MRDESIRRDQLRRSSFSSSDIDAVREQETEKFRPQPTVQNFLREIGYDASRRYTPLSEPYRSTSGATRSTQDLLQSDRSAARQAALDQLSRNYWNARLTAPQIQTMRNLAERGPEAVDRFLNTGRLPRDFHAHHEREAAKWPERARDPNNISFETAEDHRDIHSGDPSWRRMWGWQIE